MKRRISTALVLILTVSVSLAGCAKTEPELVAKHWSDDNNRPCSMIDRELHFFDIDIAQREARLEHEEQVQMILHDSNTLIDGFKIWGRIADSGEEVAAAAEIGSIKRRYNLLVDMARRQGCDFPTRKKEIHSIQNLSPKAIDAPVRRE